MATPHQHVLIVDDEAGLRRSLQAGLAQQGFTADDVEDGLTALDRIEASYHAVRPYSAIVADINLPDINGLKLLEVIKSRYPELPVVVISGYGTEQTPSEVAARRGDGYLAKPFDVVELTRLLERAGRRVPTGETAPLPDRGAAASGYALLRVTPDVDRAVLYRRLTFFDHVLYCDAVRERADLVLLLNGPSAAELERVVSELRALPEVAELDYAPVVRAAIDDHIRDFIAEYEKQHSVSGVGSAKSRADAVLGYALLEVPRDQLSATYPVLYFIDSVVSCDPVKGFADIVLLLEAPTVRGLERIVYSELRAVPGIQRARLLPIIEMFKM